MKTIANLAAFALVAAASPAVAQVLELKFGTTSTPGSVQVLSTEEFARRFNAKMAGKAKIDVYHSGQLGSDKEMLQKVKLGTLDMSQPSTAMSSVHAEFGLFDMPYLIKDRAHIKCVGSKVIWPEMAPKLEPLGYKLIGIWENGIRHISNNVRPIKTPDDLKGIKLRIPEGVWRLKMFQAYGANPTPMAFSEVFIALKTGVLDGQENPYTNIVGGKFQEVQKYLTESSHIYTPSFPTASLRRWQGYPAEVQQAIMEAAAGVQDWTYKVAATEDEDTKKKLLAAGMQFNVADRESFVKASAVVYDAFAKEVPTGKALIDKALALAAGGC
ncbi:MAG: TRAP transporter substrate-binding protein [Alphaproteobacteria bacterium]|nr:TRAP transporter substrate-binding protein [Alphaproteobacteria bacterium]